MQTTPAGDLPRAGAPLEPATVEEAVLMATVRVGKQLRTRLPDDEVDFSSLALLKMAAHQGPVRVTALATALHLDASTVSRHVKALEDRGLLERTNDPEDGRASRVAVTPQGRRCLEAGADRRRRLIGEVLADWDDADRETLRSLLNRLSDAFSNQENHS
jgi:DNA-binding MarR family transcriptional regulator